jgi:hypothetical protein
MTTPELLELSEALDWASVLMAAIALLWLGGWLIESLERDD